jgi:hypothetical protein
MATAGIAIAAIVERFGFAAAVDDHVIGGTGRARAFGPPGRSSAGAIWLLGTSRAPGGAGRRTGTAGRPGWSGGWSHHRSLAASGRCCPAPKPSTPAHVDR